MRVCTEWGEETRKKCAEYRDDGYNACAEYRDNGYNACAEYRDNGYNACSDWDSRCCTWWPCSWFCQLITWFCVAWYWVSNLVCVAWYWVSNLVCVAWYWVSNLVCVFWTFIAVAVCVVWTIIVTAVSFIVALVGVVVGLVLSLIGFVLEVIFSIPYLGRFIKMLSEVFSEIFYRILGLFDVVAWFIGIRPEKKLRLCAIILKDEKGNPVVDTQAVIEEVQAAIDILNENAKVRVIPVTWFHVSSGFSDTEQANDSYVHVDDVNSASGLLDLSCGLDGWLEDMGLSGSSFNLKLTRSCFLGNARRLLGYGEPICAFVVRSISGASGCSMGPLNNYVTVVGQETTDKTTIAHEVGHTCGLWDISSPTNNLMYGTDNNDRRNMTAFQIVNLRNSKHVTYF